MSGSGTSPTSQVVSELPDFLNNESSGQDNGSYVYEHAQAVKWIRERYGYEFPCMTVSEAITYHVLFDGLEQPIKIPSPEDKDQAGYSLVKYEDISTPDLASLAIKSNVKPVLTYRSGAFRLTFAEEKTGDTQEVIVVARFTSEDVFEQPIICVAMMSLEFISHWNEFESLTHKMVHRLRPNIDKVHVIGGYNSEMEPNVDWSDIVLPDDLKDEIRHEVERFFSSGASAYKQLKLNPMRKILLAGVPGTGKTMICNSLSNWALDQGYSVIYVSGSDRYGSSFDKVHEAMSVASHAENPSLIIVEELDAYVVNEHDRAQLLNVLDGSETPETPHGALLIATTNYPERIDDRIIRRPGRIDRIFIVPDIADKNTAIRFMKIYLGEHYRDDFESLAPTYVGKPGSFVRESVVYTLIKVINGDIKELTPDELHSSIKALNNQIGLKDGFLTDKHSDMGFVSDKSDSSNYRRVLRGVVKESSVGTSKPYRPLND